MNIMPYQDTSTFWEGPHLVGVLITLGIGLLAIIILVIAKKRGHEKIDLTSCISIITAGTVLLSVIVMLFIGITDASQRYTDHTQKAVQEMKDKGFEIVNGDLNLHPNKQGILLIEHHGESYDCSVFSPKDITKEVVFSCGPLKQSLTEIATISQTK